MEQLLEKHAMILRLLYLVKFGSYWICGGSLSCTKIQYALVVRFLKSMCSHTVLGHSPYDTMYVVYLPTHVYQQVRKEFTIIVQSSAREFERILRWFVSEDKSADAILSHSPYWQFLFLSVTVGDTIPGTSKRMKESSLHIVSTTYPEGRDSSTYDRANYLRVHLHPDKPDDSVYTHVNKDILQGVNAVGEGEFIVPIGHSYRETPIGFNGKGALRITINNASFLVDGHKTPIYLTDASEFYIAGRNALNYYDGLPVLHIADSLGFVPRIHLVRKGDTLYVSANGDVSYRGNRLGNDFTILTNGTSILFNKSIQILLQW